MMNEDRQNQSKHISYTLKLRELSRNDIERAGAKAANLGELMGAGFPVPDGFVVTTDTFSEFIDANSLSADVSREKVEAAPMPADLTEAVITAAAELGDAPLAVRSSGVAEDLPGASFAGQYETVLDVRGKDALIAAVRHCWASAFSERVLTYRKAQGQQNAAGMAVLVQCLVPADAAGVAFTANPVTGKRAETVVSAVRGLGERLVSGQASPDEWLVKNGVATCQSAPEGAISAEQARAVAELARRVEAHYGSPQDIEWASTDGQLFLLQARPITALPEQKLEPVSVEVNPPPGFWKREASHAPKPPSPMYQSMYFGYRNEGAKRAWDEFSPLFETIDYREIGGWEYIRVVPLGGVDRKPPPAWLLAVLVRLVPSMRARVKGCIESVRTNKADMFIRKWYDEWKPKQIKRINEFRDINLQTLSDTGLDEHISRMMTFFRDGIYYHFALHPAIAIPIISLATTCRELLGWEPERYVELVSGLSEKSSEPARRLAELAGLAEGRLSVRTLLEHIDNTTTEKLAEIDTEFAEAFNTYQREFGLRATNYEVCDPTLSETPGLMLGLVRDQLSRGFDPEAISISLEEKRQAALAKARAILVERPAADRERFEQALASAELAYPVREDNEFYTISAPLGLGRYMMLELGSRLAARGQIAKRDDIFFLKLDEARSALLNGGACSGQVKHRKAERAWIDAHPGPESYGTDLGQPTSFAGLPAEVKFVMEGMLWYMGHVFPEGQNTQAGTDDHRIKGIPASGSKYTGPVRVIRDETEFTRLQAGDVLVCATTSPVWSVLFPSIGALITDTGGVLSHPAIIAREYQIPAVVATGNATSLLHDGQMVTVDGGAGVVEVAPVT
jgi:pyruvate,water dikinase